MFKIRVFYRGTRLGESEPIASPKWIDVENHVRAVTKRHLVDRWCESTRKTWHLLEYDVLDWSEEPNRWLNFPCPNGLTVVVNSEEEDVIPSLTVFHPEIEETRVADGPFDVEPGPMDMHVGKTCKFKVKHTRLDDGEFRIAAVQKDWEGVVAYRVVSTHFADMVGRVVRAEDIEILQ